MSVLIMHDFGIRNLELLPKCRKGLLTNGLNKLQILQETISILPFVS